MGKRRPGAQEGKLGKPGKETPHPHLPHLSVGFFAVLKCETLSKPPTAPTLSPTSLPSSKWVEGGVGGGKKQTTTTKSIFVFNYYGHGMVVEANGDEDWG